MAVTARDLAARLAAEPDWRVPLAEFLDAIYGLWPDGAAMAAALMEPPGVPLLAFPAALLAATVEHLAVQWHLPPVPWAAAAGWGLAEPTSLAPAWVPTARMRGPPAFQARRLLADPDPLRRARRPTLPAAEWF